MKRNLLVLVSCTVLMLGCSNRSLHDRQAWRPPADLEKITSDWDVAEAICDQAAFDTQLTEQEQQRIRSGQIKTQSIGNHLPELEAGLMFLQMFSSFTANERKKQKTFAQCMYKLDWRQH